MRPKNANITKKPREKLIFNRSTYAVVQFIDSSSKLFESIPELWFINEEKTACFWPPKTGKSVTLRAMNQETPDWDWEVYECHVVSEGHATYSIGSSIVREKCAQHYNTSSADDHQEAAKFRREHPGLIDRGEKNFENLFEKSKSAKSKENIESNGEKGKPSMNDSEPIISLTSPLNTCCSKNIEEDSSASVKIQQTQSRNSGRKSSVTKSNRSRNPSCRINSESGDSEDSASCSRNYVRSGIEYSNSVERDKASVCSGRSRSGNLPGAERDSGRSRSIRGSSRRSSGNSSRRSSGNSSRRSNCNASRRSSDNSSRRSSINKSRRSSINSSRSSQRFSRQLSSRGRSASRERPPSLERLPSRQGFLRREQQSTSRERSASGHSSRCSSRRSYQSAFRSRSRSSNRIRSGSYRNISSRNSRSRTNLFHKNTSPGTSKNKSGKHQSISSPDQPHREMENRDLPSPNHLLKTLITNVNQLTNTMNKNQRRLIENDRRFARMEVTINKSFVLIGDLTNALDTRMSLGQLSREIPIPRGFRMPRMPIQHLRELTIMNRDFKNKDFFSFMVNDQKQYCTPSKATDTVIMTGFLKRFISVRTRASLVLKDLKGQEGLTLYADFPRVYEFLIEVMKAGYQVRNKILTNNDVHSVLRVVWGRSKQMLNEEKKLGAAY